jgi:hypothetical protein
MELPGISIASILSYLGATPVDIIIIVMGASAMAVARYRSSGQSGDITSLKARVKQVEFELKQLDKLTLLLSFIIHIKTGVKVVKHHRTGEYEIVNPILDQTEGQEAS